jgi:hypothetical protein
VFHCVHMTLDGSPGAAWCSGEGGRDFQMHTFLLSYPHIGCPKGLSGINYSIYFVSWSNCVIPLAMEVGA